MTRITTLIGVGAVVLSFGACAERVDSKKFVSVHRAGTALAVDIQTTGGVPLPRAEQLARNFMTEASLVKDLAKGEREKKAAAAYVDSAEALSEFLRFRYMDTDPVDSRIPLMREFKSKQVETAAKFNIPIQGTGNDEWIKAGDALKILLDAGEAKLAEANAIVNGK